MAVGYNPESPVSEAGEPQQHLGQFPIGSAPLALSHAFKDFDQTPINITGFVVDVIIEYHGDESPPPTGVGIPAIPLGTNGIVTYQWARDDMAAAGFYRMQIWVNNGSNYLASDVFTYNVYDGPGTAP